MRRRVSVVMVAALAMTCAGAPAQARSTTRAPIGLRGTTVVTGSRTAVMAVRLPRAVRLDPWRDIRINGNGRITGVVLHRDGPYDDPFVMQFRFGDCAARGCEPVWASDIVALVSPGERDTLAGTLPAGNYHLWILTDGAPVTATIHLAGLSGVVTLRPRGLAHAGLVVPEPSLAVPASGPVLYAAGYTHSYHAGGVHASILWKEIPTDKEPSSLATCYYDGPPPEGPLPPYQCPGSFVGGSSAVDEGPTPIGPGRFISALTFIDLIPQGTHSVGANSRTAGPVTSAHFQQFWLDFAL